jgi:hypothetical protein
MLADSKAKARTDLEPLTLDRQAQRTGGPYLWLYYLKLFIEYALQSLFIFWDSRL